MSFYTSLTGLKAATTELALTSNNIANVGTAGFKRSRASFGDIFATSPLQKATSVVGQGVSLKEVRQEFSQGNVEFSSNTLDLAISGEGFFPLKSADGLTDIYTRNGSFVLDEQFSVVNSSGQALLAAAVDSSGKADISKLNKLQIPTKTAGEARQTSLVELSLNLPSDADVIYGDFNRNNPNTYNKSTALSVYDSGGNSYLATIYYVKTSNATADSPFNKWQTYVYVGDDQVNAALQQATDENGELLYVNKYGELQPFSEVEDLLVNRKTQKFNLDDLTDVRTSTPATITGGKNLLGADLSADQGFNFKSWDAIDSAADLSQFMTIDIDNSGSPVTVNLSGLYEQGLVTGARLADFIQDQLNDKFGDERYFDLTASSNRSVKVTVQNKSVTLDASIDPTKPKVNGNGQPFADLTRVTIDDVVASLQAQVTEAEIGLTVGYDSALRSFTFVPTNTSDNVTIESAVQNTLFGTNSSVQSVGPDGTWGAVVTPNGDLRRPAIEQRYGITVAYDGAQETFSLVRELQEIDRR